MQYNAKIKDIEKEIFISVNCRKCKGVLFFGSGGAEENKKKHKDCLNKNGKLEVSFSWGNFF